MINILEAKSVSWELNCPECIHEFSCMMLLWRMGPITFIIFSTRPLIQRDEELFVEVMVLIHLGSGLGGRDWRCGHQGQED